MGRGSLIDVDFVKEDQRKGLSRAHVRGLHDELIVFLRILPGVGLESRVSPNTLSMTLKSHLTLLLEY
jgi:hypothetical protein